MTSEKIYEVRAQQKGLGQKKKCGSHRHVDSIKSREFSCDHLQGGQTEKGSSPSGIPTFRIQGGMEKPAKRAPKKEENWKSRIPGGKSRKCLK